MAKAQARRGTLIGSIATIIIGAALIAYVVNMIFDTMLATSTSEDTNDTIEQIRPIANAAIVLVAILAIVVTVSMMLGYLGGMG